MKDEIAVEVRHHHHHKDAEHKEEEEVKRRGCRPIAFLLSVPFAICGVLLSLAGAIVWILGSPSPMPLWDVLWRGLVMYG
ncbi:hypothetical protein KSS87_003882 [Heliosperma pusillum]|nr:hypothetical protein KSS87_003882 [Heliosperma pusillum]